MEYHIQSMEYHMILLPTTASLDLLHHHSHVHLAGIDYLTRSHGLWWDLARKLPTAGPLAHWPTGCTMDDLRLPRPSPWCQLPRTGNQSKACPSFRDHTIITDSAPLPLPSPSWRLTSAHVCSLLSTAHKYCSHLLMSQWSDLSALPSCILLCMLG